MSKILHNVCDRRTVPGYIGSWIVEPFDIAALTEKDKGRTVIYADYGRAEAGTLSSWSPTTAWARFSTGDTAAGCDPKTLFFGRSVPPGYVEGMPL